MAIWLCGYVAKWLSAKNFKIFESQISIDNLFQDVPGFFLDFFEVFWYDKMKKYGVPGPQSSRNHEKSRF